MADRIKQHESQDLILSDPRGTKNWFAEIHTKKIEQLREQLQTREKREQFIYDVKDENIDDALSNLLSAINKCYKELTQSSDDYVPQAQKHYQAFLENALQFQGASDKDLAGKKLVSDLSMISYEMQVLQIEKQKQISIAKIDKNLGEINQLSKDINKLSLDQNIKNGIVAILPLLSKSYLGTLGKSKEEFFCAVEKLGKSYEIAQTNQKCNSLSNGNILKQFTLDLQAAETAAQQFSQELQNRNVKIRDYSSIILNFMNLSGINEIEEIEMDKKYILEETEIHEKSPGFLKNCKEDFQKWNQAGRDQGYQILLSDVYCQNITNTCGFAWQEKNRFQSSLEKELKKVIERYVKSAQAALPEQ